MEGKGLMHLFELAVKNGLPAVLYRLPGEEAPKAIVQASSKLQIIDDGVDVFGVDGFVVSPWQSSKDSPAVLIKADFRFQGWEPEIPPGWLASGAQGNALGFAEPTDYNLPFEVYQNQIEQIKHAIAEGEVEKAILSRIIERKFDDPIDSAKAFANAAKMYPSAFCYLLFLPGVGIWMGASPELLIKAMGTQVYTVSLAGTQPVNGHKVEDVVWGNKERHEQQVVTDYIHSQLNQYCSNVDAVGPATVKAANLFHLRTDFTARLAAGDHMAVLKQLVKALHPTPAISGAPKQQAIELIGRVEAHSRAYYAGYLGPIDSNGDMQLFVNLRCVNIINNKAFLYVGGGITAGSDAQSEWNETVAKAKTLLNVLQ